MKKTKVNPIAVLIHALETAHENACSCCGSNSEVEDHCKAAIAFYNKLVEGISNEKD